MLEKCSARHKLEIPVNSSPVACQNCRTVRLLCGRCASTQGGSAHTCFVSTHQFIQINAHLQGKFVPKWLQVPRKDQQLVDKSHLNAEQHSEIWTLEWGENILSLNRILKHFSQRWLGISGSSSLSLAWQAWSLNWHIKPWAWLDSKLA